MSANALKKISATLVFQHTFSGLKALTIPPVLSGAASFSQVPRFSGEYLGQGPQIRAKCSGEARTKPAGLRHAQANNY
jgi:hypothetical protein